MLKIKRGRFQHGKYANCSFVRSFTSGAQCRYCNFTIEDEICRTFLILLDLKSLSFFLIQFRKVRSLALAEKKVFFLSPFYGGRIISKRVTI